MAPAFWQLDMALSREFRIREGYTLQFRGEAFNVTNSVRFDPYSASTNILNPARFGQYTGTLTKPRVFQFSLRYEF